jgi:hypothetical protein
VICHRREKVERLGKEGQERGSTGESVKKLNG